MLPSFCVAPVALDICTWESVYAVCMLAVFFAWDAFYFARWSEASAIHYKLQSNGIIWVWTISRCVLPVMERAIIRAFPKVVSSDSRQFLKCYAIMSYLVSMKRPNPNKNGTVFIFMLRPIITKLWLFENWNPIKSFWHGTNFIWKCIFFIILRNLLGVCISKCNN